MIDSKPPHRLQRTLHLQLRALTAAQTAYSKGERRAEEWRRIVRATVAREPLANLQSVFCAQFETLQGIEQIAGKALLSLAGIVRKMHLSIILFLE